MTFTTLQNKQSLQVPRIFPQKGIHVLTVYTLCQKSHTVGFLLLFLFSCDFCNILVPRAIFSNSFKSLKVSWAEGLGCHEWWNPMIMYSHCTVYKCRWWDSICHWFLSFCPEFYLGLLKEVRIFEEVCCRIQLSCSFWRTWKGFYLLFEIVAFIRCYLQEVKFAS